MKTKHSDKKCHIEALRISAILFVIFNHTQTRGFFLFSERQDSPFFWFYLFISILCKVGVPLFFMISGAMLIPKEETLKILYSKRILRIVIVLFLFSLMQYTRNTLMYGSDFSIITFFQKLYSTKLATTYGYLYSYLGFLIMLPLLRRLGNSMDQNLYIYLAIFHLIITGIVPIIQYILTQGEYTITGYFSVNIISQNIFYTLMGHYFENILEKRKYTKNILIIALLTSIISILISSFMTYYLCVNTGVWTESESQIFISVLISIPTFTIYYGAKYYFMKKSLSTKSTKLLVYFGQLTFGIMLLENITRDRTVFLFALLQPYFGSLISCTIYVLAAFILGACITALLKVIPGIKKLV